MAKNTLIKKALESLDNEKYSGVYDSLHQVTALMFSESPKEPALIISSFRKELNREKPVLKAAFLNGDIFVGVNKVGNTSTGSLRIMENVLLSDDAIVFFPAGLVWP